MEHKTHQTFGGWAISRELFDFIRNHIPEGTTILELGSGWGTGQLARYYTMYSIEHDRAWLHQQPTQYIYAPLIDGWYDISIVRERLPDKYQAILIDGPPFQLGRFGFYENLNLFRTDIPLIFDDIHKTSEQRLISAVAQQLQRTYAVHTHDGGTKQFGVIYPSQIAPNRDTP